MNAKEYAEKTSNIFVLSDSFIRIKEIIDDESSTIDDIAEVILLDPALAATMLKLANSAFFNYPGRIDTISKAMLVLGITEVYNLVIAYFTTEAFSKINADANYLESFWKRSVDCALFIKFLGTQLGVANAERLFILGLLHNLGELVVEQFSPSVVAECQVNQSNLPWLQQRQQLGFTFGECSAELLRLWHLPYCLIEPVSHQDDENFEYLSDESKLLYIAKRMMVNNYLSNNDMQVLSDSKRADMAISDDLMQAANNYCDMERMSILALLMPSHSLIY